MFTRKDFCIHKQVRYQNEYIFISDKPSMSTAICIRPNGGCKIFPELSQYLQMTGEEFLYLEENKDQIEVNKIYDFETFFS